MTDPRQDLPTDPQLSRLYHEHVVDEPADAIDQRIIFLARQAVSSGRPQEMRRKGWWQRWRMPLSLATSVMLTVMLVLLVERQPAERSAGPSREKDVVERMPKRVEPASVAPAPVKAVPVPAGPPVEKNLPRAQGSQSEPEKSRASDRAADQAMTAPSPSAKAESASPASAPSEAVASGEIRAAPAPLLKSRADNSRSPVVWLEEIRALRRAGKTEEVERQLREFRLVYPDYLLPEEFRQ